MPLRARVVALDFEGRSDGRSMRTIVTHIAPRHLVLFRGAPAALAALREHCARELQSVHPQARPLCAHAWAQVHAQPVAKQAKGTQPGVCATLYRWEPLPFPFKDRAVSRALARI